MALGRGGLVALASMMLAGCGASAAPPTSTSTPTPTPSPPASAQLAAYTAKGPDLGPGWTDAPSDNPTAIEAHPERHPCKYDYPSDYERLANYSVTITSTGNPSQVEDAVAYYAYTGARQAVKDLRTAASKCKNYYALDVNGNRYDFEVLTSMLSGRLGDESYAVDRRGTYAGFTVYITEIMARVGPYVTQPIAVAGSQMAAEQLAETAAAASVGRLRSAPH